MYKKLGVAAFAATLLLGISAAQADATASFVGAPGGWTVDRYAPASFGDVGNYAGHTDVLGIGINSLQGYGSRGGGFDNTFYNTQGMATPISGGAGSSISADLFVQSSWLSNVGGNIRTDMWGVVDNALNTIVEDYPIIGFTNAGGIGHLQVWDDMLGVWDPLSNVLSGDTWYQLGITFTGTTFQYSVDGLLEATVNADPAAFDFTSMIMQAYNYNGTDPALAGTVASDYTAYWSNDQTTAAPEAASLAMFGGGLLVLFGLFTLNRRKTVDGNQAIAA